MGQALLDTEEAKCSFAGTASFQEVGIESLSVVFNGQGQPINAALEYNVYMFGLRVASTVRQRFLENPIEARAMTIRQFV